MQVRLASAVAVVGRVEFVAGEVDQVAAVFSGELALGDDQLRLVHRPDLDGLLVLRGVVLAVGRAAVGVEVVAVRVQVVPGRQLRGAGVLALEEGAVGAVGLVGETHRVLVELGHWHHFVEVAVVGEVVLSGRGGTAWVVTP